MASLVLLLHGKFGHGLAQVWEVKDGVVAESMITFGLEGDETLTLTVTELDLPGWYCDSDGTPEAGSPFLPGHTDKLGQEEIDPFFI